MTYYDDHLQHHGVKGMKWGVRKDPLTKANRRVSKKEKKFEKRLDKADKAKIKAAGAARNVQNSIMLDNQRKASENRVSGLTGKEKHTFMDVSDTTRYLLKKSIDANRNVVIAEGKAVMAKKSLDKAKRKRDSLSN